MTVRMSRIRIEELSPGETLSEQEMALIYGAGRKKKWEFSGQAMEVLEIRQVMSAVTVAPASEPPAIPQELVPAVMNALQQLRSQASSISSGNSTIAFNSDAARQQFLKTLDSTLGGQLQGQTSAALQAAGISVVSRASLTEIDQFLSAGTAASQDLLVLRFQSTAAETLSLTAQQSQQIGAAGKTLTAGVAGTVSGTLEVSGDLVFGLDRTGRAFVREGSSLSAAVKASGVITTSTNPGSQVGLSLQGLGNLNGSSSFAIDDGDANSGENLYLDVDAVFTGFSANSVFAGDLNLAGVNATFTVPGLSSPISVPAELKLNSSGNPAELKIDDAAVEDAVTDAAAKAVIDATERLAERTRQLADRISEIPIIGEKIESELTQRLDALLDIDLPQQGVQDYLADRGFKIDSAIGLGDLIEGNLTDLFVITWHRQEIGSLITQTGSGSIGKTDDSGIGFALGGTLTVQPQYAITVTFGVDVTGGFFILEGSEVEVSITADGGLAGKAGIPNLVNVQVNASAPQGKHLINAALSASVTDGDARSGERLYPADLLQSSFATVVGAQVQLNASFAVASPVQQLPAVIRGALNGLLPDSITWTAGVSYDLVTDTLDYHINNNSLKDIVTAFQEADGVEDALKNYMLDRIAENNPLPASTQEFLGTKIPLLDQNVMDLLDIPKAAQYVLAPLAFRSRPAGIETDESLAFRLDLFRVENGVPINIRRMLSGETFDIVSLDIQQKFQKELAKITVLPETVVASYFGIVNATVQVNLNPGLFLEVDMVTGVDSLGYYIEGAKHDATAKDMQPNLKLGGIIEAEIIAEADLLFVVDFARITGTVGLRAFGDMTLVSPHTHTQKVRYSEINPDTIAVGLGVDLTLQVHGELGLVNHDKWDADVFLYGDSPDDRRLIELYRSNKVTLGDIQDQLAEYKERLQSQGKQTILAAAAVIPDPHLLAAAIAIIYQDSGMGEVVRKLVVDYRMRVDQAAVALSRAGKNISEFVDPLWSHCKNNLKEFAGALNAVGAKIGEIATHVWSRAGGDLNKLGAALKSAGGSVGEIASELWSRAGGDLNKLAMGLKSADASISNIATEVWNRAGGSLNRLASALKAANASAEEIATEIWMRSRNDLDRLAGALKAIGTGFENIASHVWSRAGGDLNKLASALVSAGDSARGIAQALGRVSTDVSKIAQALSNKVTGNLRTIAEVMWAINWTTVQNIAGGLGAVTRDATAIAEAISSKVTSDLKSIADAMYHGITWTNYRDVAEGLGSLTRNAASIAGALSGALNASISTIADAMYRGISWTSYRDVAAGLGSLTRNAGTIAGALRNTLGATFSTIADSMWHGISWTTHRDVASGLGSITRNASAIADALRNSIGASFRSIADAMYRGISWTTYTDVGRGLRAVTNDANVIASALRSGAGAADSTIRGVLQSVGQGAANLNHAINSVSNAVNSVGNAVNNVISSLASRW